MNPFDSDVDTAASHAESPLERDLEIRLVAACLASGLITMAEVSDRSEDEVLALISERRPHEHLVSHRARRRRAARAGYAVTAQRAS